jgi:hypothetical protein
MIAGRRDRRRSLIRSNVTTAALSRRLSPKNGVALFQRGSSSDFDSAAAAHPFGMPGSQTEWTTYLHQLSTLHTAGILTDEEFSAARGRLLGS